jgi:hypothetical protein
VNGSERGRDIKLLLAVAMLRDGTTDCRGQKRLQPQHGHAQNVILMELSLRVSHSHLLLIGFYYRNLYRVLKPLSKLDANSDLSRL